MTSITLDPSTAARARRSLWHAAGFHRMLYIPAIVAVGTLVAGCATGGGAVTQAPTTSLATGAAGGSARGVGLEVSARVDGVETPLDAAPAAVFAALLDVYADLQIPLTRRDVVTYTLENAGMTIRRQLGKLEARRLFDCGGTSGMPNAETYTITASVQSSVTVKAGAGVTLVSVVQASAVNPNFPGSGVRCGSSGTLEETIAKRVKEHLDKRSGHGW